MKQVAKHILPQVLFLTCILLTSKTEAETIYLEAFKSKSDTVVELAMPENHKDILVTMRASLPAVNYTEKADSHCYGISWTDSMTGTVYRLSLSPGNSTEGLSIDTYFNAIRLTATSVSGQMQTLFERQAPSAGRGKSIRTQLTMQISPGKEILAWIGSDRVLMGKVTIDSLDVSRLKFFSTGRVDLHALAYEVSPDKAKELMTEWSLPKLNEYFRTHRLKKHEGFWQYLDRTNDERYAVPGGKYLLALVADNDGGYDIIYCDGAVTMGREWMAGMRKATLTPTIFIDNYNLKWWNSEMDCLSDDTYAGFEQEAIMSLNFPLLKTVMRFSKVPMDKLSFP